MVTSRLNDRRRWGIIYCPRIGAVNKIKKWREIRAYLIEKGVTYDYIQSEDYGSVERLARMLVDNGYETIVVVGGDGAVQDALNGIMSSENHSNVSLGIIPNGIANDFTGYWGIGSSDYKKAVDCIIAGRRRDIDLGCCTYTTEEGEQRTKVFYCDPQASWQKAHIEKNHEYIRYVLPKGKSFSPYDQEDMVLLMSHINSTRRDKLGGKSPLALCTRPEQQKLISVLGLQEIPPDEINLTPRLLRRKNPEA